MWPLILTCLWSAASLHIPKHKFQLFSQRKDNAHPLSSQPVFPEAWLQSLQCSWNVSHHISMMPQLCLQPMELELKG